MKYRLRFVMILGAILLMILGAILLVLAGYAGVANTPYGWGATCTAPALPGQKVDVTLSDMGGMTGPGMMRWDVTASPSAVASGDVSFRVWNAGTLVHELVVLPLPPGGAGTRSVGPDGRVSEAGSLGEASRSCGKGAGNGIAPGAESWVTLHLAPGRYELICNLPWHYARGMFTELDVG